MTLTEAIKFTGRIKRASWSVWCQISADNQIHFSNGSIATSISIGDAIAGDWKTEPIVIESLGTVAPKSLVWDDPDFMTAKIKSIDGRRVKVSIEVLD